MNRELKFRAWDIEGKRMWYFAFYNAWYGNAGHGWTNDIYGTGFDLNGKEVMQYTGLKDKNGKEIYEGDIVNMKPSLHENVIEKCSVVWDSEYSRWGVKNYSKKYGDWEIGRLFLSEYGWIEVIGNIYENPSLINEEKK